MNVLLVQLPIPNVNFGLKTGNIPLGAACLKQAAGTIPGCRVEILPETLVSYAGDQALVAAVILRNPDIVGFTVFSWNRDRSVYLAKKIKEHTSARIVFGGPEITHDTIADLPEHVDLAVVGPGERVFRQILTGTRFWHDRQALDDGSGALLALGSPYVGGHLDLGEDRVMLLETQRGCPYRCGFCYYSKARKKREIAPDDIVLDGIAWALNHGADEVYLMDPSLNARPGLNVFLAKMAELNASRRLAFISEIRVESVTPQVAEQYRRAGFTSFEVGLQSTNPTALDIMDRPTHLDRFVAGVKALQQAGITSTVDLIFGLPGDTPEGFRQTVDFVLENDLHANVQVFPLLVLPGTAFRKNSNTLGLSYDKNPPYPVIRTAGFSPADLEEALDYAEERYDRTFYPFPDLDVSFKTPAGKDHVIHLDGQPHLSKLVLAHRRSIDSIEQVSARICSPFQIFVGRTINDKHYIEKVLGVISKTNPFVPMEIVFIAPDRIPDTGGLLAAVHGDRPHFLDLDQQYLYPEPGNRRILFTMVSWQDRLIFKGPMKRQVFWWDRPNLPEMADMNRLAHLDGILIDSDVPDEAAACWQDAMSRNHEDLMPVSFSDIFLQVRWKSLTESDKYHIPLLEGMKDKG